MVKENRGKNTKILLPSKKERELLLHLAEELGEASHEIFKVLRFGFKDHPPGKIKTNRKRLHRELNDVMAVIDELVEIGSLDIFKIHDEVNKSKKRIKMDKWKEYSSE